MRRQPIRTPNMRKVEQVGCSITFKLKLNLNVKYRQYVQSPFNSIVIVLPSQYQYSDGWLCLQFDIVTSLLSACLMSSPGITTVTPTLSWNPVACSISTDSLASSRSSNFSR